MTPSPTPSPEFESFEALGWPIAGDAAGVARSIAEGRAIDLDNPREVALPALSEHVTDGSQDAAGRIVVTEMEPQLVLSHASVPTVVLSPPTLVVGMGCNAGVEAAELRRHLEHVLAEQLLTRGSVAALASVDTKVDEPGLLALAAELEVPLLTYSSEALAQRAVPTPSSVVEEASGTPSVAEAAVLAAGADLVVPKHVAGRSTVAVGRFPHVASDAGSVEAGSSGDAPPEDTMGTSADGAAADDTSVDGAAADGTSGAR